MNTGAYDNLNTYWGDLHCHVREWRRDRFSSGELGADGPWLLDEVYEFGRHQSRLDFAAITDHDVHLAPEEWEETLAAAGRNTEPGRFIAFVGYEWSHAPGSPAGEYGHRNVIYRDTDGPLLSCAEERTNTAPKLWRALKQHVRIEDVLVIPHHPARAASSIWWNLAHWDAQLERLVEIYSLWGSSEKLGEPFEIRYLQEHSPTGRGEAEGHTVQDALARGYRFGFVAGTESHDGRPGNPLFHGPHRCGGEVCYHGGLQATYAPALERHALFDAFRARRCYATTGVKIALEFSVNGAAMGAELPPAAEREIQVRVQGTDAVERIEVVRNNAAAHCWTPAADCSDAVWRDLRGPHERDCYYVRVTQHDGNMAWSSPIWVG